MRYKIFALLLLLICSTAAVAQKATVTGTIMDGTLQEPLPGAAVVLLNPKDSTQVTCVATGVDGRVNIPVSKYGTYLLRISYIGYITQWQTITLDKKNQTLDLGEIVLQEDAKVMKEAQVTAQLAQVEMKEDTFVYNAGAFRLPEGSALEELVKKLPGAEVSEDGTIKINGKTVSKIMVGGKEFFEKDTKMAMKNIPTKMVEKIKSYEKQSDYSRITGIDDGEEETVLDLTVKKGMKNGWYGNVNLGAGTQHRYAEKFNVNHFKDDFQATLLGSANNVSDMGFGGGGGRWGWGDQGLESSKEIGGNFATAKPKLEMGGSVRYRYDGSDLENTSSTEYFNATLARYTEDYSKNMTSNQRLTGNFRIEWKPDTMTNIIFRPDFTYQRNKGRGNSLSASYSANPTDTILNRLADIMVNSNANRNMNYSTNTTLKGELQVNRKLNSRGRNLTLRVVGNYGDGRSEQLSAANCPLAYAVPPINGGTQTF